MSTVSRPPPTADPFLPRPAVIRSIVPATADVATFWIDFQDPGMRAAYAVRPGQFNMIYLPGIGEVPISVSGGPDEGPGIGHTIRFVGRVTNALRALEVGAAVGLRGPFGIGWPMAEARGKDVLIVVGGLGLAPLRLALRELMAAKHDYGRLVLLYGARQPGELLFTEDYGDWQRQGMELIVTVDRADPSWTGRVGVVPIVLRNFHFNPERILMMTCGPEIMMKYTVAEGRSLRIAERDIYLSLERNMQCAVGLCGHCQLGPEFLCKDGPVLPYPRVAPFFSVAHF